MLIRGYNSDLKIIRNAQFRNDSDELCSQINRAPDVCPELNQASSCDCRIGGEFRESGTQHLLARQRTDIHQRDEVARRHLRFGDEDVKAGAANGALQKVLKSMILHLYKVRKVCGVELASSDRVCAVLFGANYGCAR